MSKRHSKSTTRSFFWSLRPERKVLLTKEGERILNNEVRLAEAYRAIREGERPRRTRTSTEVNL